MKRLVWLTGLLAAAAVLFPVSPATARGVTYATVAGRLTDDAGAAIPRALVTLTNSSVAVAAGTVTAAANRAARCLSTTQRGGESA